MEITPILLQRLEQAVEKAGNPTKFAKLLPGIKQTTVRNWLLGITKSISEENWKKVSFAINQLLPPKRTREEIESNLEGLKNAWNKWEEWMDNTQFPEETWSSQAEYKELLNECTIRQTILKDYIKHCIDLMIEPTDLEEIVEIIIKKDYLKNITIDEIYPDDFESTSSEKHIL